MKLPLLVLTAATAGTFGLREISAPIGIARAGTASAIIRSSVIALDTVTLHVEGMTCGGCTLATRKVLERLDGVTKADVSYEKKSAVVTYDPAKVTVAQMVAAVAMLRYTATVVP